MNVPAFGIVERGQFRTRNKGTEQVEIRVWPPYSNEHVDIMLDKDTGVSWKANAIFNETNNNTKLNILTPSLYGRECIM